LLGCLVLSALLPLLLPAALLIDLGVRRSRLVTTRLALWLPGAAWVESLGLLALGAVWVATAAGSPARLRATFAVQRGYTRAHFAWVALVFQVRLEVEGAAAATPGPVLVLINHTSLVDALLPAVVLANPFGLRLRYVLKEELLLEPCLDVAGHWLPNHFVARGGQDTAGELGRVAALAQGLTPSDGVVIYPEGTRFTRSKQARAREALAGVALERALTLRHTLPPRPGGTLALLEAAPRCDVLILAHRGLEGLVSLGDIWRGGLVGLRLEVKLWRERAEALPTTPEARRAWLAARWQQLDDWLEERTHA
jgi:1-acyl-sn-glycerol-3-phosphate acyltransferase